MNIFKYMSRNTIENSVMEAIKEDKAFADITTQMCVPEDAEGIAEIYCKQESILSGIQITEVVMQFFGVYVVNYLKEDGDKMCVNDTLASIKGKLRGILSAERTILNYIQRLSGIATYTNEIVKKAEGFGIQILDTRKTTPTLRILEKYAVFSGGGVNHRMNLFDELMIKDNHIDIMKNDLTVIDRIKNKYPDKKIIVEVRNINEIEDVLKFKIDRILLDNMSPENIRKAVKIIKERCRIEVSGSIGESNIEEYLIKGVDFISIGRITHSYKSIDLSMKISDV